MLNPHNTKNTTKETQQKTHYPTKKEEWLVYHTNRFTSIHPQNMAKNHSLDKNLMIPKISISSNLPSSKMIKFLDIHKAQQTTSQIQQWNPTLNLIEHKFLK